MNPASRMRLEKTLVLLLGASLALPLVLGALLWIGHPRLPLSAWLRNTTLRGVQFQSEGKANLTFANVLSARYQTASARRYDAAFPGREVLVRCIDELYLRAFRTSPTSVVIGPDLWLFEAIYPTEYCLLRSDDSMLRPLSADLRRLQNACDASGVAFALIITPSKAAIYPEKLPPDWPRRYRPGPRYYERFLPLLRQDGVRYVDGHEIALAMKGTVVLPVFPQGGTHWADPLALATTNALLELLARKNLGVQPIRDFGTSVVTSDSKGQDGDLAKLLTMIAPPRFPVPVVTVHPSEPPPAHRPRALVIGGSFTWKMLRMLTDSRQFSELDFYFYYKVSKHRAADGPIRKVASPAPPIDFGREVFGTDVVLLEINEQALHDPHHLMVFLRDALAALPESPTKPSIR